METRRSEGREPIDADRIGIGIIRIHRLVPRQGLIACTLVCCIAWALGGYAQRPSDVGWTMDLESMEVPDGGVMGKLGGDDFEPDKTTLENGDLSFRKGVGFIADAEIKIMLFLDRSKSLNGKTFEITRSRPFGQGVPHVHLNYKKQGAVFPEIEMFMNEYAMRLQFGEAVNRRMPGTIYLSLPDKSKSFIAGAFTADLALDPLAAPLAMDAPYVHGRIDIKGQGELDLKAGYFGITSAGETQGNMTGTSISLGGGFAAVKSLSFKPRVTSLAYHRNVGCVFQHIKMEPGQYLIYVRWGDRYVDGRWVEIEENTQMTLDLTVDRENTGTLVVSLPAGSSEREAALTPLDETGNLPIPLARWQISNSLGAISLSPSGKTTIDGLRPGRYRVVADDVEADAEVRAGQTVTVELSSNP